MLRRLFLLASMVTMIAGAFALPDARAGQQAREVAAFGDLESVLNAELKETSTPGAAIGIVRGDRLVYAKGFGVSNVETGSLVTPDMLFRLGSTTKMFTAAALIKLVESGRIDLDAPIGKYAQGLDPAIARLTSAQLLSHSAGLKDEAIMYGKHDDAELGVTVRALNQQSLFSEPGKVYAYSNPGYWLSGYVVEQVTGKPYADALETALFQPLGMIRTTLRPTMAMTFPLSQGHEGPVTEKPHVIRPFADNTGNWPAGSMFSSVNDLSRFVIAFMNEGKIDGREVLTSSLIAALSKPRVDIPQSDARYGFGLTISQDRGTRVLQHTGGRSGFGSLIRMFPEKRLAIIILINRTGGSLKKTALRATELLTPDSSTPKDTK